MRAHTQVQTHARIHTHAPAPRRPTYNKSGASGLPFVIRAFISAKRNLSSRSDSRNRVPVPTLASLPV